MVINKKTKYIIILEFKRVSDTIETYYSDIKSIPEKYHTSMLEGLNTLAEERGWVVEVLPLVTGQRSVREKEWLESMKMFGIHVFLHPLCRGWKKNHLQGRDSQGNIQKRTSTHTPESEGVRGWCDLLPLKIYCGPSSEIIQSPE